MSSTITVIPNSITQPDANSYTGKSSSFVYKGKTHKCQFAGDKQYKHGWKDLNNLSKGKVARCGDKATKMCDYHREYNWDGFRNVCPIAGQCGTYATPATIRLSNFNFKDKNVKGKNKIDKVVLKFSHKNNGVDVGTGQESKSWGGKFSKLVITLYKYNTQTKKLQKLQEKTISNKPPVNVYQNCITTFEPNKVLNLSQHESLAIDISYGRNENTNPCIIRMTGLSIKVSYTPQDQPKISCSGTQTACTDPDKNYNCATIIKHIVSANTKEVAENIQVKSLPNKWIEKSSILSEKTKIFSFIDISGVPGVKTIKYKSTVDGYTGEASIGVNIVNKVKPEIDIVRTYKKSDLKEDEEGMPSDFDMLSKYIKINNNSKQCCCYNKILYSIDDSTDKFIITKTSYDYDYDYINEIFYKNMSKLSCGEHIISFYYDDETTPFVKKTVNIVPPVYSFDFELPPYDIVDQKLYKQNKEEIESEYKYIVIKRTDNEKSNPILSSIFNETWINKDSHGGVFDENWNKIDSDFEFKKNSLIYLGLGLYFYGDFNIGFYFSNYCKDNIKRSEVISIKSNHTQYYDDLYLRTEDSNEHYDSIVIRKGDYNTKPVIIDNFELKNSLDGLKLYVAGGQEKLSTFGFGILKVEYSGTETINNLYIELNPRIKNDEYSDERCPLKSKLNWSNEWAPFGMFDSFKNNFEIYNDFLDGLVEIVNLSPDDDSIDEESVFIKIKEIKQNQSIQMKIPFLSKFEKVIYLDFYINDQKVLSNSTSGPKLYPINGDSDEFWCKSLDSVILQTNDLIDLDLDIKYIDEDNVYDDIDINERDSNEECICDKEVKIRYKIDNNDTVVTNKKYSFRVENSLELTPKSYLTYLNGVNNGGEDVDSSTEINDTSQFTNGNIKFYRQKTKENIKLANKKVKIYIDEDGIIKRYNGYTDQNGFGLFNYKIPTDKIDRISINDLKQKNIMKIEFDGDNEYNPSFWGDIPSNKTKTNIVINENDITSCCVINESQDVFINNNGKFPEDYTDEDIANNISQNLSLTDLVNGGTTLVISGILTDDIGNPIPDKFVELFVDDTIEEIPKQDGDKKGLLIDKSYFKNLLNLNKTGSFTFFIRLKESVGQTTLQDILSKTIISFNGDDNFEKSTYNDLKIPEEMGKNKTSIVVKDNFKEYKPNEIIPIEFQINGEKTSWKNYIDFDVRLSKPEEDEFGFLDQNAFIDIVYEINGCNGIYETKFKTNDLKLVDKEIVKKIYYNIPTSLDVSANINSNIVQQNDPNKIKLTVFNGKKPNKDVKIKIKLTNTDNCPLITNDIDGRYDFIDINITDGTYSYDNSKKILTWNIEKMDEYSSQEMTLEIKADKIGSSSVSIEVYDYLNKQNPAEVINTALKSIFKSDYIDEETNEYKYYINKSIYIASVLEDSSKEQIEDQLIYYKIIKGDESDNDSLLLGDYTNYHEFDSLIKDNNGEFEFVDYSDPNKESNTYALYHHLPLSAGEYQIKTLFPRKESDDYIYNGSDCLASENGNPEKNNIIIEKIPTKISIIDESINMGSNTYKISLMEDIKTQHQNENELILNKNLIISLDGSKTEYNINTGKDGFAYVTFPDGVESYYVIFNETNIFRRSVKQFSKN